MQLTTAKRRRGGLALLFALAALLALALACGSGIEVEKEDDVEEGGEVIGTLTGIVNYFGERSGTRLVVGLADQWPMSGPPVRFWDVPGFTGNFPVTYQFELDEYLEGKSYFPIAFLDVDETDVNLMMNSEIDPLSLPTQDEEPVPIEAGVVVYDFTLDDPENVDYWWEDDQ